MSADKKPTSDRPEETAAQQPKPEPRGMMSHKVGYDSAQKSGYDTEAASPEARQTTNEVHARAQEPDREQNEEQKREHQDRPRA